MTIIRKLSEMISEEIADARKYVNCALNHKADNLPLADTFFKLSQEEMNHMSMLHDQVTRIIDSYKKEHGDPPESMLAVYNYLHEKQMDDAAEVKAKQMLYRDN